MKVYLLCNMIKNTNNLYYKTIFSFTNNLLTEYFNKIYHSCLVVDDKYTYNTFQKLSNLSKKTIFSYTFNVSNY